MPYPLGLNFGPTYITVSRASEDGSITPVTRVTASAAYQDFFWQSLQKRVQNGLQSWPGEQLPDPHLFPPETQAEELLALLLTKLTLSDQTLHESWGPPQ